MTQLNQASEDSGNTIEKLHLNDEAHLVKIYQTHREKFIAWGRTKQPRLDDHDLEDAFQDAVIVLFKKMRAKKIQSSDNIIGYLRGIYKNKLSHKFKDKIKTEPTEDINDILLQDWDDSIYRKTNQEHLKYLFKLSFEKIGETCMNILKLKIYDNLDSQAIADRLGYRNATVVHSKTYTCLKRLREIVMDKI